MAELVDKKAKVEEKQSDEPEKGLDQLAVPDTDNEPGQEPPAEPDLPDKYKGKSTAEIVKMHQELESEYGRQGNVVGELRKTVDDFILSQTQQKQDDTEEDEDVDIFTEPEKAVQKILRNSPEFKRAVQAADQIDALSAKEALQAKHPDAQEIVASPQFQEWVQKSDSRKHKLLMAHQQFDVEAADDLFTTWKELQAVVKSAAQTESKQEVQSQRKQAVRKASTGVVRSGQGNPGAKKYRRADIIELMKTDPKRYQRLAKEIRTAYQEGRVVD